MSKSFEVAEAILCPGSKALPSATKLYVLIQTACSDARATALSIQNPSLSRGHRGGQDHKADQDAK